MLISDWRSDVCSSDLTLYAAAKSYLIKFSESLALEHSEHGIHVTALCPGFTYSEFHDITGPRAQVSRLPRWMWLSAEQVAWEGIAPLERGDVMIVTGREIGRETGRDRVCEYV